MRRSFLIVLLAVLLGARIGAAALAEPPPTFEQAMQRMFERLDEIDQSDLPTNEERRARADVVFIETANGLDLEALTLDEIGILLGRPRMILHAPSGHDLRPRLREILHPRATKGDVSGAHAALLLARLESVAGSDRTTPALLGAITHPGAAALWSDRRGDPLWSLCVRAVLEAPRSVALEAIGSLLDRVPDDFAPDNLSKVDDLYEALIALA